MKRVLLTGLFALTLVACSPSKPATPDTPDTKASPAPGITAAVDTDAPVTITVPVSPEVQAAMEAYKAWRDEILKGDTPLDEDWQKQARDGWRASLKETDPFRKELAERVAYDQFPRLADVWSPTGQAAIAEAIGADLAPMRRVEFGEMLVGDLLETDAENIDWLRTLYEERGAWFPISEVGDIAAKNAWLIVQHATDDPFLMARVLADMEFMVKEGEADPSNFALLYDRVHMQAGKPQRYGTQFTCRDGVIQPHAIEDEFDLDMRRKGVGLEPMAEYSKRFAEMTC